MIATWIMVKLASPVAHQWPTRVVQLQHVHTGKWKILKYGSGYTDHEVRKKSSPSVYSALLTHDCAL